MKRRQAMGGALALLLTGAAGVPGPALSREERFIALFRKLPQRERDAYARALCRSVLHGMAMRDSAIIMLRECGHGEAEAARLVDEALSTPQGA